MASDNWQYSSQWTSPNPLHWQLTSGHWQLTSGNNEHHQIKTLKSGPKIKKMLLLVFTFRCLTTGNIQRKMTLWQLTTGSFSQNEQHQQQIYSMNFLHFTFGIWQLATFITMNITKVTKPFALATDIWPLATDISGNNEHRQIKTLKSGPKIKKCCLLLVSFTFRCLTTGNMQRKMTLCAETDNWQF